MTLADLRTEYAARGLTEEEAGADPFRLFHDWLNTAIASGVREPNAMTLATATPGGLPSARIVLLKHLDDRGLTFFTNYHSRKAAEMDANPRVALVLFWYELERQVRVEGQIEKTTEQESDDYFATRPADSRLGAWASCQSSVLPNRAELERLHRELEARFANGEIPRPPNWGGYRVIPDMFEFWQGRPSRLHDRIQFRKVQRVWQRNRLAP